MKAKLDRILVTALALSVLTFPESGRAADCSRTFTGLVPLNDLGSGAYQGFTGGLYPGGSNVRPGAHEAAGIAIIRKQVLPRDADGNVDLTNGKIVFASIGMSNTNQEFQPFLELAANDPEVNSKLVLVNGAQGGKAVSQWANPNDSVWQSLADKLAAQGVTAAQLQVVWVKHASRASEIPSSFPEGPNRVLEWLKATLQILKKNYPQVRVAYFSSRIYAGYASTNLNPEPVAYETGFAVKWLIEQQINGAPDLGYEGPDAPVPWFSWGPYLWADGLGADGAEGGVAGRSDGLEWLCSEFAQDGTHPSTSGRQKVARMLHSWLKNDATSRLWYLSQSSAATTLLYFPQVGDGVSGNIRFQSTLVLVNTAERAPVTLEFFQTTSTSQEQVKPMIVSLGNLGSGAVFQFDLETGQGISLQTPGRDGLQVGYARVTTLPGVAGTAIFTRSQQDSGQIVVEAGVPAATPLEEFTVFVDSLGDWDTGLAMVNTATAGSGSDPTATVTLRLYNTSFQWLGQRTLTLGPGQHRAHFVFELLGEAVPQAGEMQGVVTVASDQPLAAVTLRQRDDPLRDFPEEVPALTAFPVISGRADP